jgi:hypothetical protein
VAGSKKILHHTAFVGRISVDMTLSELPLHLCNKSWGVQAGRVSGFAAPKVSDPRRVLFEPHIYNPTKYEQHIQEGT